MLLESAIALSLGLGYWVLTNDKKPERVRLTGYRELNSMRGSGVYIEYVR